MFLQALDGSPNGWSALIVLIGSLTTIATTLITYFLSKRDNARTRAVAQVAATETVAQTPRLDQIHVLVNGRLSAALEEVASLKSQVAALKEPPSNELPIS